MTSQEVAEMESADKILEITMDMGKAKTQKSLEAKLILGFIGGAMISLGYLAYMRIVGGMPESLGGLGSFLGACVFPVGLIIILLAGGELVTGNMMAVSAALIGRKVKVREWAANLLVITLANAVGALFVAYIFGHVVGLTSGEVYGHEVIAVAKAKLSANAIQCFFSGIGCNWFVGLALWLCYGAKDGIAKMVGIWFPVMTFVAIGFQHSVANLFAIPAAIFEGYGTWMQLLQNVIPVYLGNIAGGLVFVALLYYRAYHGHVHLAK